MINKFEALTHVREAVKKIYICHGGGSEGSFRVFLFFLVFPLFLEWWSNPKDGGWILDFAGDVVISRGCLLKLVSPSMIWQCA